MADIEPARRFDVGGVMLPRPFKINRLGHFGLYVADPIASHHFYGTLLGLRLTDVVPAEDGKGPDRARFYTYNGDHHSFVMIHNSVGKARDERYDQGITVNQMSFQVGTLEEVVQAHQLLRENGANIWRIGRDVPGSNWAVYFYDADRHTVELFYGMEQIGWNRRAKPYSIFGKYVTWEEPTLPQPGEAAEVTAEDGGEIDLSSGYRWEDEAEARYDVGGVLAPRPFKIMRGQPISLFTHDLDAAIAFYTDTMGLLLTEESVCQGERIAYLRAAGEHHIITLAPIALRARLGLNESTTLLAQGVQVGSYRQLKEAVRFLEENGCRQVMLPPELHTGIDYAAHFADPDGHLVQLYFSMEQVGWDGRPRPADQRRKIQTPWPETIDALDDTYTDRTYQGPLA